MRDFLCDILHFIEKHKSEEKEPFHVFTENVTFMLPTIHKDGWKYIRKERFPITLLPTLVPFVQAVDGHPIIGKEIYKRVGTSHGYRELNAWIIIYRVLRVLLNQQSGIEFEESEFESVFGQMMEFFKSDTVFEEIVAPLENFVYNGKECVLHNGWHLKLIDRKDKEYWEFYASLPRIEEVASRQFFAKWSLVKEYQTKRLVLPLEGEFNPDTRQMDQLRYEINDVVSSFHLVMKGGIVQRLIQTRVKGWWGTGGPEITWEPHVRPAFGTWGRFIAQEIDKSIEIMSLLSQIKKKTPYRIALQRLDYIIERGGSPRVEDKILDATIGLESLFLVGIKEELSYRLSLRAAYLLGSTGDERRRFFKAVRKLYDLRSAIIHGYNEKKINDALTSLKSVQNQENEMTLETASSLAEDILRISLRKLLPILATKKKSIGDVNTSLDQMIERGEALNYSSN